ncbi:MAG: aldehyde dehydrogenase family protein [Thiolinea sp.]
MVERSIHDEFVELLGEAARNIRVGDPLLLTTQVGAVSSAEQLQKDLQHVQRAQEEGAQLVTGERRFMSIPVVFTCNRRCLPECSHKCGWHRKRCSGRCWA